MARPLLAFLLAAAPALAGPPDLPRFLTLDQMKQEYDARIEQARKEEEFLAKPREEKLVILFEEKGEEAVFEGKKLKADYVVKEIFEKWKEFQSPTPGQETIDVTERLKKALQARLVNVKEIDKNERYRASVPLVDALDHKLYHVRKAAIDCLSAVYATELFYKPDPDVTPQQRKQWKQSWEKHIAKMRK